MSHDDIIQLNVGGVQYTTTRFTLCHYPDSMFSGRHDCKVDDSGRVFIDRDGSMFKHILNFLRSGRLLLPNDFSDFALLANEADFYQIQTLIHELKTSKDVYRKSVSVIEIIERRPMKCDESYSISVVVFGERQILQKYIDLSKY